MINYIFITIFYVLFFAGCVGTDTSKSNSVSNNNIDFSGKDLLWNNCSFLSEQELNTLDNLLNDLNENNAVSHDRTVFEKYIKIISLVDKTDQELLNCAPSTPEIRERVLKHFVFLGLRYGRGEFSFVNNPRLASHFEREYLYDYPKREFIKKMLGSATYSKSDEVVANYILGGIIAMQASLNMASKDMDYIVREIADGFKILKYGRTSIFTNILYKYRNNLHALVAGFLKYDKSFAQAFSAMRHVSAGIYPMMLKEDRPYYPKDFSEIIPKAKYVVGIGTSPGSQTPLGSGFFAQLSGQALFLTAGHWQYNRQLYVRYQVNEDPIGSAKTRFVWNNERLDIFNMSEQLFVPILKALGCSTEQIIKLRNKLGTNPFASAFSSFVWLFPWIDVAIALPQQTHVDQTGLNKDKLPKLVALSDKTKIYSGLVYAFGTTENLESYGSDKAPGLMRFSAGNLYFSLYTDQGYQAERLVLFTPIRLAQLDHVLKEHTFAAYSMRLGPRCSGSPIFVRNNIVGLLQGPVIDHEDEYIGIRSVHFTNEFLALISELITDRRGLHAIPEADLVAMVRKHMFNDPAKRETMRQELLRITGI